jgi:hypothetical protein
MSNLLYQLKDELSNNVTLGHILPQFEGFAGPYLPFEVKREEITLIEMNDLMALLKMEYFTSYHQLSTDIKFDRNNFSYYNTSFQDEVSFYM